MRTLIVLDDHLFVGSFESSTFDDLPVYPQLNHQLCSLAPSIWISDMSEFQRSDLTIYEYAVRIGRDNVRQWWHIAQASTSRCAYDLSACQGESLPWHRYPRYCVASASQKRIA